MKKIVLTIGGMTCSACSNGLEKYLNKQDGIQNANVNLVMANALIEYDETKIDRKKLDEFIKKAGFKSLGIYNPKEEENKHKKDKIWFIVFGILAVILLYIAMGQMIGKPIIKLLNMELNPKIYSVTLCVLTILFLIYGLDIIKSGFKNLFHKAPNMDTLVAIGVISSFIYSCYSMVMILQGHNHYIHQLYFESAAIVLFFIKLGRYLDRISKDKTKTAIQKLVQITPSKAIIKVDGKEKEVTIDEIKKGDIVISHAGDRISVDGEIIQGKAHLDESFLTGESKPVTKAGGNKVIAGSINYDGYIEYRAEKIGRDSSISNIVKMVVEATNTKAPIARIADKISGYFVPTIIAIAMIAFIIWFLITKNFAIAINILVTILVVACPCSLGLATPLAIVIASGNASKKGILVKTSEALENAHKVKAICFDKTGTLTKGELTISKIYNYSSLPENEIIKLVASIENKSEHPIARAIVNEAKSLKIELEEIADFKAIPGYGVSATIKEKRYLIGNKKLMLENNITILQEQNELELVSEGNSILFIAENQNLITLIGVKDVLKDESIDIVKKLQKRNIEVVMLTGDNEKTANAIAKQIGVDKVIANVLPKQKAEEIKKLKQKGLVMMCGDGINDSVSLVTADIGVSVSNGTDIAMDSSNVVLMNDNLEKIEDLLSISQKTITNIKQNLFWAFFYNICMIPIACGVLEPLGIVMNPMMAAFAMTISSLTVILNALRLKRMDN